MGHALFKLYLISRKTLFENVAKCCAASFEAVPRPLMPAGRSSNQHFPSMLTAAVTHFKRIGAEPRIHDHRGEITAANREQRKDGH